MDSESASHRESATRLQSTFKPGWQGRFFEDFEVGDVYRHRLGRTVLSTDSAWFSLLTQNTAPVSIDAHYAAQTEWAKPVVDPTFTLALVAGQSVPDVAQNAKAHIGWDRIRLAEPVFVGDTIYSQSEVLETRTSDSQPDAGIVTVETTGYNQRGAPIITFQRTMLIYRRGRAPAAPGLASRQMAP